MTAFAILSGKSLKSAIASYGKSAATFTERTHQLAYSALSHVEEHHDAVYCNAIYNVTPKNYRLAVARWFLAFGKVSFDPKDATFTYAKAKKSDLPTALTISPADYEKAKSTKGAKGAKSLLERMETMVADALKSDDATNFDRKVAKAVQTVLESFRKAAPKVESATVVKIESKAKPEAAPKASKPKVAAKADEAEGGMMTAKQAAAEQRARLAAASASIAA